VNYGTFVDGVRRAFEHRGGIKSLHLGTLNPDWFADIQREAAWIINRASSSDVGAANHVTHWTRPHGQVQQFSLFNSSGRSEDYLGDYGYRNDTGRKRLVFPHLKAIARFAALFGGNLRNLRLNGMGTEASLSAHEEESMSALRWGVEYIVRFHLPVFTNPKAHVYLDDERFHYDEGALYFFNHGCVHSAANAGAEPRYHLVLDAFLDRSLFRNLFPGTPPADLGLRKTAPEDVVMAGTPFPSPEFVCEDGRVISTGICYGRRAPTTLDFYLRNYPSLFSWMRRPAAASAQT
jgi:hypothetical protein